MTRRLLALVAIGCSALLAGCGSATPAPAPGDPGGTGGDTGPVTPKVNRVVLATASPATETNDPGPIVAPDMWQLRPMYESLVGVDPSNSKLIPQLATEWKVEPDGSSYRFTLRKGVQFQKGYGEFTSKDLMPAFQERTSNDYVHGTALYWRRAVSGIDLVNDYEAVYKLPRADANFLNIYVSEQSGSMLLFSKAHFDKQGRPQITGEPTAGTAAYAFKERAQGQYVRFERVNFPHWRGTPDFPEFEFRWVKEPSTRLAALLTGEIQLASLPEDLLQQASKQGAGVARGKVPGLRTYVTFQCCYFNDLKDPSKGYMYPNSPLMDVRVRRALAKASDLDAINKAFFNSKGEAMYLNPFHPTRAGWNPDWEKRFKDEYGYEPEKARQLLAEAGYGPGKPLSTSVLVGPAPGYSGAEDVAEALASQWRQVGVNVELLNLDPTTKAANQRNWKFENDVTVSATGSDQWTGMSQFGSTLGPPGSGPHLPDLEKLLPQIEQTLDPAKSEELWKQAGEVVYSQHQYIPLFWLPVEIAYDKRVVADWVFPGAITGSWTHPQNIKAAR